MTKLDTTTRRYPNAKNSFLRYQIGRSIMRPTNEPIYEGPRKHGKLLGQRATGQQEPVFDLLGYGETLAEAEIMAANRMRTLGM